MGVCTAVSCAAVRVLRLEPPSPGSSFHEAESETCRKGKNALGNPARPRECVGALQGGLPGRLCCLCIKNRRASSMSSEGNGGVWRIGTRRATADASFDCGFTRAGGAPCRGAGTLGAGSGRARRETPISAGCPVHEQAEPRCGALLWIFIQQAVDHLSKGSRNRILGARGNRFIDGRRRYRPGTSR